MTTHVAVSTLGRCIVGATFVGAAIAVAACGDDTNLTRPLLRAVSLSPGAPTSLGKGNAHGALPILFATDRDGNYEIYKMNPDGSGQTRLTFLSANDNQAVWSPDGTRIAFFSTRENPNGEIYSMNADGSGVTRLTNTSGSSTRPSWSPDGTKIVFQSTRDAADPSAILVAASWEIFTMNADGSGVTRITNNSVGDIYPTWSADGAHIAFSSDRDHLGSTAARDLYMMDTNGANVVRLTNQDGQLLGAAFDPKSHRIAYSVMTPARLPGVYVLDLNTKVSTRLTFGAGNDDLWPSWSPDGKQLAFAHYANGAADIYLMNADGSNKIQLTTNVANDSWPKWSR